MLQTQVGVCEQHKNSWQTRFYLTPTVCKHVCHLFLCRSHTPTWICQRCLRPTQSCIVLSCIYMRPAELDEFLNGMEECKYGTFFFQVPDLHTKPFKVSPVPPVRFSSVQRFVGTHVNGVLVLTERSMASGEENG